MRVHAWDGELEPVRDIGPARVRAFHVRGGSQPFSSSWNSAHREQLQAIQPLARFWKK